ncbi:UDP-3-0-acyl N-acetylglucosamine deacetylase [Reticulomyxa filosa]|uniref:UDP-3-0-acyl N-acetylglucosamine deacetylase n=1 Tax=Reticulomyxa filosa TaxID=46433 RepID=X6MB20_RETFI|nr:UDP-3-0-acyl N-acetylglucosamine deacetylase [Reticulomyxa filosa]|eukprot:ETO11054.1 UDP-3-0-acyl N-acetylglucosamine deacetylase [Reticulomyxa filosa]
MDGSSFTFVSLIEQVGTISQNDYRKVIKVVKPIEIEIEDKRIEIVPDDSFTIDCKISFDNKVIGEQNFIFSENQTCFEKDISKARTFGFIKDLDLLHKIGLGKGVSLENSIGLDEEGVVNKDGLRYADEFVRHKVLDCIGDLYLAGARLQGRVKSFKGGHAMNNKILRKLFSNPSAYVLIDPSKRLAAA